MKGKIFFRADAGKDIGYGHFTRSLALADMLKDDFDCTFFTKNPSNYQLQEVSKVCKLSSNVDGFLEELKGDETVVLDNYFFTSEFQKQIKDKGCRLVCIDDMHDKHYYADIVINHGCNDETLFDVEDSTILCLGIKWALLRNSFFKFKKDAKVRGSWLISFGGSDPYNLSSKYIKILQDKGIKDIHLVIGDGYQYANEFGVKSYKNLSAEQMADLMSRCENAILPTSTVCLEALSQGCNVYAGYYVDNQIGMYNYLVSDNLIHSLGSLLENKDFIPQDSLSVQIGDTRLNYSLLFNPYSFIDYTALPLSAHREIWKIRNDFQIRQYMSSSEEISWESHCNFVKSLSDNKRYWAVYKDGVFLASVNITYISENVVERGIFINPSLFGKSIGTKVEDETIKILKKLRVVKILAKVLKTNTNSLYFHTKNHYSVVSEDDRYYFLERQVYE